MKIQVDLDFNGHKLVKPKLGGILIWMVNLQKNGNNRLFDGSNGELTMLNHLNMNSFLIKEAKLDGNLNLNGNGVYDNDVSLLRYVSGALKVSVPVVQPNFVHTIVSNIIPKVSPIFQNFNFGLYTTQGLRNPNKFYPMFSKIIGIRFYFLGTAKGTIKLAITTTYVNGNRNSSDLYVLSFLAPENGNYVDIMLKNRFLVLDLKKLLTRVPYLPASQQIYFETNGNATNVCLELKCIK